MIIDLDEKDECGTFELAGGGKVHLRLLTIDDLKVMRKACLKTVPEYPLLDGKYQRFEGQTFDGDLFDEMKWDRVITGWDDLFDRNKKPIPVIKENKILLMSPGKAPEFVRAVEEGLKTLKDADAEKFRAAEKN